MTTAKNLRQRKSSDGFTMMEILIVTLIILPIFVSVMYLFVKSMEAADLSRNTARALLVVKSKMADIDNTSFNQVKATFNNVTFTTSNLTGRGVSYVDDAQAGILRITTTFCWRERSGRVIGEDLDLDGQLDSGEDKNANGILDSPVSLATVRYL